jgi:DNA primase
MSSDKKKPFINDELKDQLKQEANILEVLRTFGLNDDDIKPTNNPDQITAKCVFPDCPPPKPNDYPLGINLAENKFNCFHCGRGGDIYKLIMLFKNTDFYHSKLFLYELCRGTKEAIANITQTPTESKTNPSPKETPKKIIYKPFRRQLTGLRTEGLPTLDEKGITAKTAKDFGVGYCSQGLMKGRIVVPVYDSQIPGTDTKNILCYAGYSLTKRAQEYGDWRFPDGFEKARHLYNLNRVTVETKHARETLQKHGLIVVESFWNVLKLAQAGINNTVAIMGTHLSVEQEKLLLNTTNKIKLWLDEDGPGKLALQNILRPPQQGGLNGLLYKTHIQIIKPSLKYKISSEKVKPYQFTEEEILGILTS